MSVYYIPVRSELSAIILIESIRQGYMGAPPVGVPTTFVDYHRRLESHGDLLAKFFSFPKGKFENGKYTITDGIVTVTAAPTLQSDKLSLWGLEINIASDMTLEELFQKNGGSFAFEYAAVA